MVKFPSSSFNPPIILLFRHLPHLLTVRTSSHARARISRFIHKHMLQTSLFTLHIAPQPNLFQVITEKASDQTTIHLLMQGANAADSGMYKCVPGNAPPAKIKVHILKGEDEKSSSVKYSLITPSSHSLLCGKWGRGLLLLGFSEPFALFCVQLSHRPDFGLASEAQSCTQSTCTPRERDFTIMEEMGDRETFFRVSYPSQYHQPVVSPFPKRQPLSIPDNGGGERLLCVCGVVEKPITASAGVSVHKTTVRRIRVTSQEQEEEEETFSDRCLTTWSGAQMTVLRRSSP